MAGKGVAAGILAKEDIDYYTEQSEIKLVTAAMERWKSVHAQRKAKHTAWLRRRNDKRLQYWLDRVPRGIAVEQTTWERGQQVLRARAAGIPYQQIAKLFGYTSGERMRQLEAKIVRQRSHPATIERGYALSPVERYFNRGFEENELEQFGKAAATRKNVPPSYSRNAYEALA